MAGDQATGWQELLEVALQDVGAEGTFAVTANDAGPLPDVAVRGVGKLSLPLDGEQAKDLLFAGEAAPFGKGLHTETDPAVRKATQIAGSRLRFAASWEPTLQRITADAVSALGLGGPSAHGVQAHLYKLLLYEQGGHFMAHRDTEKEPGMFGTLLIQLPVLGGHQGGSLHVYHEEQEVEWDSAAGSDAAGCGLRYAAFFADCEHELAAVTSGLRVVLAYNLVRTHTPGPQHQGVAVSAAALEAVTAAARVWEEAPACEILVAVPLEHKYTQENLSFAGLKGHDAACVELLCACPLLDVHLVLMTKEVVNSVAYEPKRRRRGRGFWGCSDDEHEDEAAMAETAEITDEICTNKTDMWVSPWGEKMSGLELGLKRQLDGSKLFEDGDEPYSKEYEGYTGNAGPTLTLFYNRALAVVWPRSRRSTVACAAGFEPALGEAERRMEKLAPAPPPQPAPQLQPWRQQSYFRLEERTKVEQLLERLERRQPHAVDTGPLSRQEWEAVQALEAAVSFAEHDPGSRFHGPTPSRNQWDRPPPVGVEAARALGLATCPSALALLGEARRADPAARLVNALGWSRLGPGTTELVTLLATAASTLASPAFDKAVVDLAARHAPKQFEQCMQLATNTAAPEALRNRLAQVVMGTALGEAGFAQLQTRGVCYLARLVLEGGQPFQGHAAAFVDALQRRQDRQPLLQALLQEQAVARAAAAGQPQAVQLAAARAQHLEAILCSGPPVLSWEQPNARLPGLPQVEAFLRGPYPQQQFTDFKSITDARKWAETHFNSNRQQQLGYRATATPDGRGMGSFVTVRKSRETYDRHLQQYQTNLKELATVRCMVVVVDTPVQAQRVEVAAPPSHTVPQTAPGVGGTAASFATAVPRPPVTAGSAVGRQQGGAATTVSGAVVAAGAAPGMQGRPATPAGGPSNQQAGSGSGQPFAQRQAGSQLAVGPAWAAPTKDTAGTYQAQQAAQVHLQAQHAAHAHATAQAQAKAQAQAQAQGAGNTSNMVDSVPHQQIAEVRAQAAAQAQTMVQASVSFQQNIALLSLHGLSTAHLASLQTTPQGRAMLAAALEQLQNRQQRAALATAPGQGLGGQSVGR